MQKDTPSPSFEQWLIESGKSDKTAKNYSQTIKGSLSQWAIENSICETPLLEYNGVAPISRIVYEIRELEIYKTRNTKGKGMYGAALRWFEEYAINRFDDAVTQDIHEVLKDQNVTDTERTTLVSARVGQGRFRDALINKWGRCSATGYDQISMLVASHIKPWNRSNNTERLDPFNGLLLTPNLDKAFDRNFISFDLKGEIKISQELEEPERLSIFPEMKIKIEDGHLPYMSFHLNHCFRG